MNYFEILSCSKELSNCCNNAELSGILQIFHNITDFIQIVVPILLIIFATIRFVSQATSFSEKDGMKHIITPFLAAAIVFFIPVIMDIILGIMPESFSIATCWSEAKSYHEASSRFETEYMELDYSIDKSRILPNSKDFEKGDKNSDTGNNSSTIVSGSAKGILEGAEKVHTVYEQQGWSYYSSLNELIWNDIKASTNNPSKKVCCATFVGSALYAGGVFPENVINQYNYNLPDDISRLCQEHGWTKITSYSQLAPGDVVIMSGPGGGSSIGHTQIYAGNGTWYNAGSNQAIQMNNPYPTDSSSRFLYAWRKNN